MPKVKTHSGAKKRLKISKTGKILRGHASGGHNLSKKSMARKRRINATGTVEGKARTSILRKLGV